MPAHCVQQGSAALRARAGLLCAGRAPDTRVFQSLMRCAKYFGWLLLVAACHDNRETPQARVAASAQSANAQSAAREQLAAAEQRRDSAGISAESLSSRDLVSRRFAV